MNFKIRSFSKEGDLGLMNDMLKSQAMSELERDALEYFPPNGFVVSFDGKPVCLGFVILCDNKSCINTDIVGYKNCPKEVRNEGVKILREKLYQIGRDHGCKVTIATTESDKLIQRLKDQGYWVITSGITNLGRNLWP